MTPERDLAEDLTALQASADRLRLDVEALHGRLARIDAKIDRLTRPRMSRAEAWCAVVFAGGIALVALGLALQLMSASG